MLHQKSVRVKTVRIATIIGFLTIVPQYFYLLWGSHTVATMIPTTFAKNVALVTTMLIFK